MTAIDFAAFVDELAHASGEVILPFFRTSLGVEGKSGKTEFDPVTAADRAGEVVMRNLIRDRLPAHGILGEEYGADRPDAEWVWVLDPIDGTKSFISGIPMWGTLIGLAHRGTPVYGLMNQPFLGEKFSGDGAAARYCGPRGPRDLHVRRCHDIGEATTFTTSPRLMRPRERSRYARVEAAARLSRYGGDCYAYCMLAAGHVDLVVETGLAPHDIVALIPIIEGAGGIVTTWTGEPAAAGGRIIAAGDARIHAQAMDILNG